MSMSRKSGYTGSDGLIVIMIIGTVFVAGAWCIKAACTAAIQRVGRLKRAPARFAQAAAEQSASIKQDSVTARKRLGAGKAYQTPIIAETDGLQGRSAAAEQAPDRRKLHVLAYQNTRTTINSQPGDRKKLANLHLLVVKSAHPDGFAGDPAEKEAGVPQRPWPEIERIRDEA